MDHAITVGDVVNYMLVAGGIIGGLLLIGGLCILAVYLLNPFRSGH